MKDRRFVSMLLGISSLVLTTGMSPQTPSTDEQAQARTVLDVERVGRAMYVWLADQVEGDAAGAPRAGFTSSPVISHADLEALLVPWYIQDVPELDGWNHPYELRLDTDPLALEPIAVRSPGRDGIYSAGPYEYGWFDPESFDEDIVWKNGGFVRQPEARPGSLSDPAAQHRTRTDISFLGTALFSWLTDQVGFAPRGTAALPEAVTIHFPDYPEISHEDLTDILVPQYTSRVPERDGWGWPYDFRLNTADILAPAVMAVRSPGRDGVFSGDTYAVSRFDSDLFDEDLVWADGFAVRWPSADPGALSFYTVPPCRAIDTRPASALQSGVPGTIQLGGLCSIPLTARAVAVNVTVLGPTGTGHVALFPAGFPVSTSTVNFAAGQTRANHAIVSLSWTGLGAQATVAGDGQVHLLLDVNGYFE